MAINPIISPLTPRIEGGIVVLRIPPNTPPEARSKAIQEAKRLAVGASSKGKKYKRDWSYYKKANQTQLL